MPQYTPLFLSLQRSKSTSRVPGSSSMHTIVLSTVLHYSSSPLPVEWEYFNTQVQYCTKMELLSVTNILYEVQIQSQLVQVLVLRRLLHCATSMYDVLYYLVVNIYTW